MAARGERRGGVERERRTAFDKSEFVYLDEKLDAHVGPMPFEVIDAMTSIEKKAAVTRIMEDIVQKGQVEPWCATRLKKAQRATTTGLISPLRHQIRDRIWTTAKSLLTASYEAGSYPGFFGLAEETQLRSRDVLRRDGGWRRRCRRPLVLALLDLGRLRTSDLT